MAARLWLRLLAAMLLALPLAAGCVASGSESAPGGDEIALYEDDDPFAGGKADGTGLAALHHVADYAVAREHRVLEQELAGAGFPRETTLVAGARLVVLRRLSFDQVPSAIVVDDESFELWLVGAAALEASSRLASDGELPSFRYEAALARSAQAVLCELHPGAAGSPAAKRFAVTVDMCQSSRSWEQGFFDYLVALSEQLGEPTEVSIAMTGLWAHRHPGDFRQLVAWQAQGKLDITWVNHSYYHQLSKQPDGSYDFLTAPSVDLEAGVLALEVLLLEQGVMFSPLFRFPGLTHDERTLGELNRLGLFALDANGWLAKGEPVADRSVVLLHGNGNEKPGIDLFLDWASDHAAELQDGRAVIADALETLPLATEELASEAFAPCAP